MQNGFTYAPQRQTGGTCYAHATARAMLHEWRKVHGVKAPAYNDLVAVIAKRFGSNGGWPQEVVRFCGDPATAATDGSFDWKPGDVAAGDYFHLPRLHVSVPVVSELVNHLTSFAVQDKEVVICFWLCKAHWARFEAFFQSNRSAALTAADLRLPSGTAEGVLGGHAVVLDPSQSSPNRICFKNSWGTGFGDRGCFAVDSLSTLEPSSRKVEALVLHWKHSELSAAAQHAMREARQNDFTFVPQLLPSDIHAELNAHGSRTILGRGASAVVFAATFQGERVAVKEYPPISPAAGGAADALHGYSHPNILVVKGQCNAAVAGNAAVCPPKWLVLERADDVLEKWAARDQTTVLTVANAVARAVNHLQQQTSVVVHGDIKPANVFRVGDVWKLGDFSTSQRGGVRPNSGTGGWTDPDVLTGSPIPPGELTKVDVFSLGRLLSLDAGLGRDPFVRKCLSTNRAERPTVGEVLSYTEDALDYLAQRRPVAAAVPSRFSLSQVSGNTCATAVRDVLRSGFREAARMVTCVVLGETGSGKTTLLNLLLNLFSQSGYEMSNLINVGGERPEGALGESSTDATCEYTLTFPEGTLRIVDTPGFGDTRGVEINRKHAAAITECITKLEAVNAIVIVVNGRSSRLTATTNFVLASLATVLPSEARENIIVVATNCRDSLDANFSLEMLGKELLHPDAAKWPQMIFIDNPLALLPRLPEFADIPSAEAAIRNRFQEAADQCTKLARALVSLPQRTTVAFRRMSVARSAAEVALSNYVNAVREGINCTAELQRHLANLGEFAQAMAATEHFESGLTMTQVVKVPCDRHNTLCFASGCASNCHVPCDLQYGADLLNCLAFKRANACMVCGHPKSQHGHGQYSNEKQSVVTVDPVLEQRFRTAKSAADKEQLAKEVLETALRRVEQEKARQKAVLTEALTSLRRVATTGAFERFVAAKRSFVEEEIEAFDAATFPCPCCRARRTCGVLLACAEGGRTLNHMLCDTCSRQRESCPVCQRRRGDRAEEVALSREELPQRNPRLSFLKELVDELTQHLRIIA